jgi:hypothetical protein
LNACLVQNIYVTDILDNAPEFIDNYETVIGYMTNGTNKMYAIDIGGKYTFKGDTIVLGNKGNYGDKVPCNKFTEFVHNDQNANGEREFIGMLFEIIIDILSY